LTKGVEGAVENESGVVGTEVEGLKAIIGVGPSNARTKASELEASPNAKAPLEAALETFGSGDSLRAIALGDLDADLCTETIDACVMFIIPCMKPCITC